MTCLHDSVNSFFRLHFFSHNNLFHSAQEFSLILFVSVCPLCSGKRMKETMLNGVPVLNKTDYWEQCKMCLLNISLSGNGLYLIKHISYLRLHSLVVRVAVQ